MLEQSMITYCAPTLAALATGNLFTCACEDLEGLEGQVAQCNGCLNCRGVLLRVLRAAGGKALVYVFRPRKLWKDLKAPGVKEFLLENGYQPDTLCGLIRQLGERVQQDSGFPHEIGIFLGYPLEDVRGFIENKGNNYKCAGYWKVYSDEAQAKAMFDKFRHCSQVYGKLFLQGSSLKQLTVTA